MEAKIAFLQEYPILSLLIMNVFISIILAVKVLYATTPEYKKAYREADTAKKIHLVYEVFNFKTQHVTKEGAKHRAKLFLSGILYVILLIFL